MTDPRMPPSLRVSADRRARAFAAAATSLGTALLLLVWLTPVSGELPLLARERLPALAPALDPSWLPGGTSLAWAGLLCLGLAGLWVGRRSEDSYEPLAVLSAWLAVVAGAAAVRGIPYCDGLAVPTVFGLAFGSAAAAAAIGFAALLRIGCGSAHKRGAWLAAAALFIPSSQMWWMMHFFVAPTYAQARPTAYPLTLPQVASPQQDICRTNHLPRLDVFPGRDTVQFRFHHGSLEGEPEQREWRAALAQFAEHAATESIDRTDPTDWASGDPMYLCVDERVPMASVLEALEACFASGSLQVILATEFPGLSVRGLLICYDPTLPGFEGLLPSLTVRANAPLYPQLKHVPPEDADEFLTLIEVDPSIAWKKVAELIARLQGEGDQFFALRAIET